MKDVKKKMNNSSVSSLTYRVSAADLKHLFGDDLVLNESTFESAQFGVVTVHMMLGNVYLTFRTMQPDAVKRFMSKYTLCTD